ncbi:MAG: 16S rRNA (cytosine(1402)-N(4))-methyltransferase RsmH [Patescibacteria group bacterium]|nr:16S rRNA (cytosine(1402)-N(4))-methyltransferase RsmH [Patescibacteria group bacterium]
MKIQDKEIFDRIHKPVLQKEILQYLDPKPNENFIDATVSEMGHTITILNRIKPDGKILGIEWDPKIIEKSRLYLENSELDSRIILVNDSYINLKKIVEKYKFKPVNGILFDLGMSSWHLENSNKGFSFLKDELLDMRYNQTNELSATEIINNWKESEIERILMEYGEEKFAKKISKEIVKERKIKFIKTTFQLIEIIKKAIPLKYQHKKIHFATRTFQALRIAVNDELNNLNKVLPQAIEILAPKGKIAIISFHSLEDRIVKNFLKKEKEKLISLTKKPIIPLQEEIKINPRSRSAKLRVAVKIK